MSPENTIDSPRPHRPARSFLFSHALPLVGFALALIAVSWLAVVYDMKHEWQERAESIDKNLDGFARAVEGHVGVTVHAIDALLQSLRAEYRHHPNIAPQVRLVTGALLDKALVQVGIIDANGMLTYSSLNPDGAPVYLGDRPHFAVHRDSLNDQLFISEPVLGRVSKRWTLQFSRKLTRPNGSFGGVIVLSLDVDYFNRFYESINVGTAGIITIIGTDHIVRARSAGQAMALGREISDFKAFAPGAPQQGHFPQRSPVDQVNRIFAYRTLPDVPLVVVVGVAEVDAFAAMIEQRRTYYAVAALVSFGIIACVAILLVKTRRQTIAEARYRHLLQHASEGMIVGDRNGIIHEANRECCKLLGCAEAALIGRPVSDIELSAPKRDGLDKGKLGEAGASSHWEGTCRRMDGSMFPVEVSVSTIPGDQNLRFVMFRDITERKAQDAQVWHQANFDTLTGLPNRALFRDRFAVALAQVKRRGGSMAVMFIDLDHFKSVNDTLGHEAGDETLRTAARRLLDCVREEDTVARLGGDEFCVILPHLSEPDETAVVARKIIDALGAPFVLEGQQIHLGCSIGIAVHPANGADPDVLLRNADAAMYQAKARGRSQYALCQP